MSDLAPQIAQLRAEIARLSQSLPALDGLPAPQQSLRTALAAKQQVLATLLGQLQLGGITIDIASMGDVVFGDKVVGTKHTGSASRPPLPADAQGTVQPSTNQEALLPRDASRPSSASGMPTGQRLTLLLSRQREGYELILLEGGSATTGLLALTPQQLQDLLAYAHSELRAIVHDNTGGRRPFQTALTIPPQLAEATLARLARLGAALWQGLFSGPGSNPSSHALGEQLRRRSQAGPLRVDVVAAHLPFPWALLYDRDPRQPVDLDGFWGFRHLLAAVPLSGRSRNPDPVLGTANRLRMLAAFNLGLDWAPAGAGLIAAQRERLEALGLLVEEAQDEAALAAALAAGSDAELLYFLGHAASALPGEQPSADLAPGVGSTRLVLTTDAAALTLRGLQAAAPLGPTPLLRSGPLVLINACQSTRLSPLTYDGLAPYLLDQGARAVVGTESDTPVAFGSAFAPDLLRRLATSHQPLAEALRDTRRDYVELYGNPLGLLYALYGSAELRVPTAEETAA